MDSNIIRAYVGEVIEDKHSKHWLIISIIYDVFSFINLNTGERLNRTWRNFKFEYFPLKRIGKLNGVEILEGEDWLCHDKRCLPGILSGGCSGCIYSGLIREKKRYYEPGDIVYIPSEKMEKSVTETSLFYSIEKHGAPIKFTSLYRNFNDMIFSVRFRLGIESSRFYRWDEIRLVKRKRHFINPSQLDHICNELCLYGPYSTKKCWECKTGKIWREIYDVRRSC